MSRRILRRCAVCSEKPVFNNEKLCGECLAIYKDDLETPWMQFLIKDANEARNREIVRSKHEGPMYALESQVLATHRVNYPFVKKGGNNS